LLVSLCGEFAVLQAPVFECLSFDPFSFANNGLSATDVNVRRRDVVEALVVSLMIVVIDEGFDLVP